MKFLLRSPETGAPSLDNFFAAILFCFPTLLFLVRGGMNGSLFVLAALSIYLLISHKYKINTADRGTIAFGIAMTSGLIVVLISQIYHADLTARYFDSPARFLLAVPVLLALRLVSGQATSLLQYAFPLGSIAALGAVWWTNPVAENFATTSYMNHIHLGDLALMLAFLSLLGINWTQTDGLATKLLKIAGLLAGLIVSVLSSARGGWIAIPVFLAIFVYFRTKGSFINKVAVAALLVGAVGLGGYFFVDAVHQRLGLIYSELFTFGAGNVDTSIGIRLQLWKAAFHLIGENPVFGVGADGFGKAMDTLSASGYVTTLAAVYGKAEVHNEILAQTVRFGIFGLISILAIYFVPFALFLRAGKTAAPQQKVAAMMGMCLTLGFFMFGLTVEMFDLKMTAAFYALTVGALLAAATRKPEANNPNSTHPQGA